MLHEKTKTGTGHKRKLYRFVGLNVHTHGAEHNSTMLGENVSLGLRRNGERPIYQEDAEN